MWVISRLPLHCEETRANRLDIDCIDLCSRCDILIDRAHQHEQAVFDASQSNRLSKIGFEKIRRLFRIWSAHQSQRPFPSLFWSLRGSQVDRASSALFHLICCAAFSALWDWRGCHRWRISNMNGRQSTISSSLTLTCLCRHHRWSEHRSGSGYLSGQCTPVRRNSGRIRAVLGIIATGWHP